MTISPRFVVALSAALGLTLIPTVMHTYVGALERDGRSVQAIPTTLLGWSSTPTTRAESWMQEQFDAQDWVERRYTEDRQTVVLGVIRSFDLKRLYHHPELALAYGASFVREETLRPATAPNVPVHVLFTEGDAVGAAYVMHYGDGFVENPISFQIRSSIELLVRPRKAMTLFFAREQPESRAGAEASPSVRFVLAAAGAFLEQPQAR